MKLKLLGSAINAATTVTGSTKERPHDSHYVFNNGSKHSWLQLKFFK